MEMWRRYETFRSGKGLQVSISPCINFYYPIKAHKGIHDMTPNENYSIISMAKNMAKKCKYRPNF
jgi:hypothetical protein